MLDVTGRTAGIVLAMSLVAGSCAGGSGTATTSPGESDSRVTTTRAPSSTEPSDAPATVASSASCPQLPATTWAAELSATTVPLLDEGDITVEAVVYPHPDYEGKPWSQWGQGFATSDGRFFSAIGDHLGLDGNSYVYEFDLTTKTLTLIADVGQVLGHEPGSWGYGKVHGQMVEGPCGIYLSSYWGKRKDIVFDDHYRGDRLMVLDPEARTIADVGVIADGHGVASLASDPAEGLIYAEAVDPLAEERSGSFVVLDASGGEIFRAPKSIGFRAMAVDAEGRAYFSTGGGTLAVYDPAVNSVDGELRGLPGDWLRAATAPAPDGTVYAVTREPDAMFAIEPGGTVRSLGPVRGYVATLAMSPDGGQVYYIPHAHGQSWTEGTPLIVVDTASGEEIELLSLNEAAERELGLTLGGTYNMVMAPDGRTLFIGMNANDAGEKSTFGTVVLLIVHLDP